MAKVRGEFAVSLQHSCPSCPPVAPSISPASLPAFSTRSFLPVSCNGEGERRVRRVSPPSTSSRLALLPRLLPPRRRFPRFPQGFLISPSQHSLRHGALRGPRSLSLHLCESAPAVLFCGAYEDSLCHPCDEKVLDECLRAVSGFKGVDDFQDLRLVDIQCISSSTRSKKISSSPSF